MNVTVYFAEHLIAEILSRLPVKILLRCRCVSKPWCSLIDSPRFVKAHIKWSIECNTNSGLIVSDGILYSVNFDFLDNATVVEIDQPLKSLLYDSTIMGSCNGLHCLLTPKSGMFAWNPATRKCKKLAPAPTDLLRPFKYSQASMYGFGYDGVNDDYKVLSVLQPAHAVDGYKVLVYGMKTDSWKRLQNLPSHFQNIGAWCIYSSGALHWLVIKTVGQESCISIFAVDLGVEKYREVPMPKVQHKDINEMGLVIFDRSLCLLEYHPHIRVDVWVMNDYGVENSWCKLFTVEHKKVIRNYCMSVIPIAYSKNRGDVLLQVDNMKAMWYNLQRKKIKTIKNMPDSFGLEAYTESIVPPDYKLWSEILAYVYEIVIVAVIPN
ncbi:putative F-box domain-containing protein [Heracleum sosnowskyi]|uniref:F-box domain-containing protein n=1 Tax=Heracleum sosnowskyi TaxID=360622 RepID=A0AAD8MAX5_9APIA|nr:putative F-box domain-containing protein [Heracleum sosnowskyi]